MALCLWCCQHLKFHIQVLCFCLFSGLHIWTDETCRRKYCLNRTKRKGNTIDCAVNIWAQWNIPWPCYHDSGTSECLALMYKIYCHLVMFLAVTMLSEVGSSFWKVWIIKNVHKTWICHGSLRHNTLRFNSPSDNFDKILPRLTLPSWR